MKRTATAKSLFEMATAPVMFVASPRAYFALIRGASIAVDVALETTLTVGAVVAVGEPWALRRCGDSLIALEYRHDQQSYYVFDDAALADAELWTLPVDQWHTEMVSWAVRRWASVADLHISGDTVGRGIAVLRRKELQ